VDKPADLFDRDAEWHALDEFVRRAGAGLRLGVVYGRRRQGKSFLLRRLVRAAGGLYIMPLEEERVPALQRFADQLGESLLGLPPGSLQFNSWDSAFRAAFDALPRARRSVPPVVVVDELPYLLAHSPEIPSVLQQIYDESRQRPDAPPVRLIVCGSALSVMTELLSGSRALRGRAVLDLCLRAFTFREAAQFWRLSNPETALAVHAVLGGTPGYRDLIASDPPQRVGNLARWLAGNVLSPSHALFSEADYLLREDPRVTDRALYHSILTAIAGGASTPTQIGAAIGRAAQSLPHPLTVLQTAGFVARVEDVLLQRRARLTIADPIVRFHRLVVAPRLAQLEEHRAAEVWAQAAETVRANIIGPHFEQLARDWTARHGRDEGLREPVGVVGPTIVNDSTGRTRHEIDVVGLAPGEPIHSRNPRVLVLGEAKHSARPRGITDAERLRRLRDILVARGVDAADAQLLLFTRTAPEPALARAAAGDDEILVLDLPALYGRSRR
jgi:AAA+ ATPase superfamily predicted ATPase